MLNVLSGPAANKAMDQTPAGPSRPATCVRTPRYAAIAEERLVVLRDDVSLLEGIESELAVHREDMTRVQKEFEDRVVSDAPRTIEKRVAELIDWLVDQDFRQWQAVTLLGAPDVGSFHSERAHLIESIGREAARVVETYDHRREAETIAEHARVAVTTAAADFPPS